MMTVHRCDPSNEINVAIQAAENRGHWDTVNYLRGLTNNDGAVF